MFNCEDCGNLAASPKTCTEDGCSATICVYCAQECTVCNKANLCSNHKHQCDKCDGQACIEHSVECHKCGEFFCTNHLHDCSKCRKPICDECGIGWHECT